MIEIEGLLLFHNVTAFIVNTQIKNAVINRDKGVSVSVTLLQWGVYEVVCYKIFHSQNKHVPLIFCERTGGDMDTDILICKGFSICFNGMRSSAHTSLGFFFYPLN